MPKVIPSFIARSSEPSLQFLKLGMPSICCAETGDARHKNAAAVSPARIFITNLPLMLSDAAARTRRAAPFGQGEAFTTPTACQRAAPHLEPRLDQSFGQQCRFDCGR